MTDEELEEFADLGKRMLELYEKFPQNESKRKIIIAKSKEITTNNLVFFQGTREDALYLYAYMKTM